MKNSTLNTTDFDPSLLSEEVYITMLDQCGDQAACVQEIDWAFQFGDNNLVDGNRALTNKMSREAITFENGESNTNKFCANTKGVL